MQRQLAGYIKDIVDQGETAECSRLNLIGILRRQLYFLDSDIDAVLVQLIIIRLRERCDDATVQAFARDLVENELTFPRLEEML